jgi:hypothetical protein
MEGGDLFEENRKLKEWIGQWRMSYEQLTANHNQLLETHDRTMNEMKYFYDAQIMQLRFDLFEV